jgi:hypothetical protein
MALRYYFVVPYGSICRLNPYASSEGEGSHRLCSSSRSLENSFQKRSRYQTLERRQRSSASSFS